MGDNAGTEDPPVKLAIDAVDGIKEKVKSFGQDETHDFVVNLKTDLEKLGKAQIIERSVLTIHEAMKNLNNALQNTKETVTATECKSIKDIQDAFKKYGITTVLDQLRKVIAKGMLSAVLDSISMGTSSKNKDETEENIAAVYALHGPLRELERLISQPPSTNEKRKHKTDGDKPKPIIFDKWSDLYDRTTGREDIPNKDNSNCIYKTKLDKVDVVIKRILVPYEERKEMEQLNGELQLLQKLKHPNIVKLVGFCYEYSGRQLEVPEGRNNVKFAGEGGALGIISRYASNKTMVDVNEGNAGNLDWPHLFGIIQGIAKGVHHMHKKCVVHLNLKPENILMKGSENAQPQINKIRKARELKGGAKEITLDAKSLPAKGKYVGPELVVGGMDRISMGVASTLIATCVNKVSAKASEAMMYHGSAKSDVYSFGVILLETIGLRCATTVSTRKEGCATTVSTRKEGCANKSESDQFPHPKVWARTIKESRMNLNGQFDRSGLLTGEAQRAEAEWCVIVGLLCCMPKPEHRPSMGVVIDMLGS